MPPLFLKSILSLGLTAALVASAASEESWVPDGLPAASVAGDRAANVHLPDAGHDYGPSKRAAIYRFMAAHLGLDLSAVQTADGRIDESKITIESAGPMHVCNEDFSLPGRALRDAGKVEAVLKSLQK